MHLFDSSKIKHQILLFIREWIALLFEEKFAEACNRIDGSIHPENSVAWTPELLNEVLMDYAWHERMPVVTNPAKMDLTDEQVYFYKYDSPAQHGYAVEYDIPLDGEWSDLTAQFSFVENSNNLYTITLEGIHVL
ncbi:DUF7668 domain-containing protein [Hymenobacter lucidus]|uniref:DUF7668 domain-containing protein n=1 Tax=Hymenobacter lucidus TaxID=2880930 RepID=A0ABS8AQD5_9BACT|nr:hypothetical protein [Hymenobacter lucidus]MCB2408238.1 hypothetical protein [Hymenobacter lucidus]